MSVTEIAKALDLSSGNVRRQFSTINLWLNKYHCSIEKHSNGKITISFVGNTRRELWANLANEDSPASTLSPQERIDFLIFLLHISAEPKITQEFQNLLQVSRSTVLEDLSQVARWFERQHLFLVRRPNYGVKLIGKESDWRKIFIDLVTSQFDEPTLFHFCTKISVANSNLTLQNPPLAKAMTSYLTTLNLDKARDLVRFVETKLRTRFVDSDHLALTLHIALMIKRIPEQNVIETDKAQIQALNGLSAYTVAAEVAQLIGESFGISIPISEVNHLTIQVLGSKLDNRIPLAVPADAEELAQAILERSASLLRRPLDEDRELAGRLAAHLIPTLHRLARGLPIRNPLLEEIRIRYPEVYSTAEAASAILGEYTGRKIPSDEIAYIAMYLAGALMRYEEMLLVRALIVCPSGSATSWLLHSRLKKVFPNIHVLEICSNRDLKRGIPSNVELLISTVPLTQNEVPMVVVNALLTDDDIQKIQKSVETITKYTL